MNFKNPKLLPHYKNAKLVPPHIAKLVTALDRKLLGIKTAEEQMAQWKASTRSSLTKQLVAYLELRDIKVGWAATHKKSTYTKGWPDITFSVMSHGFPTPCAWEVKMGSDMLSKDQIDMLERLQARPNCWRVRVINTFNQAVDELRELGV
jgi:hypothetical protein